MILSKARHQELTKKSGVHKTLSQKTHYKNRACGVAQNEGPLFKPQYRKKKKKKIQSITEGPSL
jgi:hypothetical protein